MQDVLDTDSWHDIITLDKLMAEDLRNIGLSYTEDGFNVTSVTPFAHDRVQHCATGGLSVRTP